MSRREKYRVNFRKNGNSKVHKYVTITTYTIRWSSVKKKENVSIAPACFKIKFLSKSFQAFYNGFSFELDSFNTTK